MEGYFWTIRDIAADPRVALTPGSLQAGLHAKEYPPLVRDSSIGPTNLYLESTVEAWIQALLRWRAEAPARAAAKRAEAQRRHRDAFDAEMVRLRANKLIGDTAQQGYDNLVADMRDLDKL
jgi:hypothetical protein